MKAMGGTKPERGTIRSKMIAGFCFLQAPFSNDASFREISARVDPQKFACNGLSKIYASQKKSPWKAVFPYFVAILWEAIPQAGDS